MPATVVVDSGPLVALFDKDDWDRLLEVLKKYADRPVDFTDATLVMLCER